MSDNPERESSGNDSSNKLKGVLSRVLSVLGGEQGTGYK